MAQFTRILFLAASASALGACGGVDIASRERPDEFAVQRQAPLVVPPDFHLVPPQPGAPRPVEGTASEQALEALFGGPQQRSAVETRALELAGLADPGIRSAIGDEGTFTVNKGTEVRTILAAPQGDGQAARVVIPG
ncbi:DUF3035 domain-containing protein [Erythrobacter sp. EC-HK427]|uniref:DUF3035 domain-containing protein n=1 Tax=Erythrobacter sp. EC-HK427 TaxID=2038396 RepID=UPI001252F8AC|nr:DUF3035 domain-containing protein [Erythrobacter sp. EC-HK427]VVT04114.1 conserved exported hypothetical protein [Erythrobacter sp. EC-HK427]